MSCIKIDIRRILEFPFFYELLQNISALPALRKRFIEEFVRPFDGAKILDVGCGPGRILEYFPNSIEYIGYDENPKYIVEAQKKYNKRASFFCASVNEASTHELCKDQFDFVIAFCVLHHLNDYQTEVFFKNAYKCLKSGGTVVTIDPVYVQHQSIIKKWYISKDRGQYVRTDKEYTKLASKEYSSIDTFFIPNAQRVPVDQFVVRATKHLT